MADVPVCPFDELSDELKLRILHLAACSDDSRPSFGQRRLLVWGSVCKDWARLLSDTTFWRRVDLSDVRAAVTDAQLAKMAADHPRMRAIALQGCSNVTREGIAALAAHCPLLETVELTGTAFSQIDAAAITDLVANCSHLTALSLPADVTDDALDALVPRFSALRSLSLERCFRVTDFGMMRVASLAGLTAFNASGCWKTTEASLGAVVARCKKLENVSFAKCERGVTEATLRGLANLPSLHTLDLSFCSNMTEDGLTTLFANVGSRLRRLSLDMCEETVRQPAAEAIGRHCAVLEHLSLAGCTKVEPAAVCEIIARCGSTLRSLDLREVLTLDDTVLHALGAHAPGLTRLDVSDCGQLRNDGLDKLTASCRGLTSLMARNCMNFTTRGINLLTERCQRLAELDVSNCVNFGDAALTMVAERLPRLETLTISACTGVTDAGIEALARNAKSLRALALRRCSRLTDRALHSLVEHAAALVSLDLYHCRGMTEEGKDAARDCFLKVTDSVVPDYAGHTALGVAAYHGARKRRELAEVIEPRGERVAAPLLSEALLGRLTTRL